MVNPHVAPNTVGVGDYTASLIVTHGGIHNSPNAISCKSGTDPIPALFSVMEEESVVVTCFNIKVTPGEITLNFSPETPDTEKPVWAVYKVGALSTADNIPVIFTNRCFPDPGRDTAIYLIIKHTEGYVLIAGGVTADSGNPDRI